MLVCRTGEDAARFQDAVADSLHRPMTAPSPARVGARPGRPTLAEGPAYEALSDAAYRDVRQSPRTQPCVRLANSTGPIRTGRGGAGKRRAHGGFLVASAEPGNRSAPRLPSDGAPAAYQALVRDAAIRPMGRDRVSSGVPASPGRSGTGRGFQPAMVRAQARACVMSVMAGNGRRSSTAAENSPCCSKAASDGGGVCLGDDEHAGRMGVRARAGKHLRPDSLACRVPFMFPDMAAGRDPGQSAP